MFSCNLLQQLTLLRWDEDKLASHFNRFYHNKWPRNAVQVFMLRETGGRAISNLFGNLFTFYFVFPSFAANVLREWIQLTDV